MNFDAKAQTHALERTSPMGELFIGYCVLCGREGLTMGAALQPCLNPRDVSFGQVVIDAIEGTT